MRVSDNPVCLMSADLSGTKLPCIVEGLKSTCGGQEGSLSSYDLGPRPSGSVRMARDQQQESECGSIDNTGVIPSSGQARHVHIKHLPSLQISCRFTDWTGPALP